MVLLLRCESPVLARTCGSRQQRKVSAMEGKPDGRRTRPEPPFLTLSRNSYSTDPLCDALCRRFRRQACDVQSKQRIAAAIEQWSSNGLGRLIGYLPQDVELLAGTGIPAFRYLSFAMPRAVATR